MFLQSVFSSATRNIAALAISLAAVTALPAAATTYPDFTLSTSASSIQVTSQSCSPSCSYDASFVGGDVDFTFNSASDTLVLDNLIKWTVNGVGSGYFSVLLDLVFTSPSVQSAGTGGVGVLGTFYGIVTGGAIAWQQPDLQVAFGQGTVLDVELEDGFFLSSGRSVYSGLTISPNTLVPFETPSPVPLPAALPALLAMLMGGFGFGWFRKRKANMVPA